MFRRVITGHRAHIFVNKYRLMIEYKYILRLVIFSGSFLTAANGEQRSSRIAVVSTQSTEFGFRDCDRWNSCTSSPNQTAERDLRSANCMCDAKCEQYGDCCVDYALSDPTLARQRYDCVTTAINGHVYMKTVCPRRWTEPTTKARCETTDPIEPWIFTPVTNVDTSTTYKNLYCALCNGETKFAFWHIGFRFETINKTQSLDDELDPEELLPELKANNAGPWYWTSTWQNITYGLELQPKLPFRGEKFVRYCNERRNTSCQPSYSYRNTSFLPYTLLFERVRTIIPDANHCWDIPPDNSAFRLLCANVTRTFPMVACYPPKTQRDSCLINGLFDTNEVVFKNNFTLYLTSYEYEYSTPEWKWFDARTVYVCGSYFPRTVFQQRMLAINSWTTALLAKLSIFFLCLHLVVFILLIDRQKMSTRNLAAYSFVLLTVYACHELGPPIGCEWSAVLLHFSYMSCFTWLLIMSYDCWLGLYRATTKLLPVGPENLRKFALYVCVSFAIPSIIIGAALLAELAPTRLVPCEWKPGYGQFRSCFISQRRALYVFYFAPSSIIFALNAAFFAHTTFMIYASQRTTSAMKQNAGNDVRMYVRLALMMGVTWILSSLITVTNSLLVGFAHDLLNMSHGSFIFFAFTCKKRILGELAIKYGDENGFITATLTTFVRSSDLQEMTQRKRSVNKSNTTSSDNF